jgi:hypothetical protein
MVRFAVKLVLFVAITLSVWLVLLYIPSRGFSDRFEMKFNEPCGSMITGSSRALLSMSPDEIDPTGFFQKPFLNFAFTQRTSPYGEVYYHAISHKLFSGTKNGIFLLEVNPLAIYTASDSFAESGLILGRMHFFNLNPNPEYVLLNSEHALYQLYLKPPAANNNVVYHSSGWNENTIDADTSLRSKKIAEQYTAHEKLFKEWENPAYRLHWLERTIQLMKAQGNVILVRVPVRPEMRELERKYYPGFDELMDSIAERNKAKYWNYLDDEGYDFYDIHHMTGPSAKRFSSELNRRLVQERILSN